MDDTLSKGGKGRLPNGQFGPGHSMPGPGNPGLRVAGELRNAVNAACTPDQVKQVLARLHGLALEGNVPAAREWLDRAIGKPATQAENEAVAREVFLRMLSQVWLKLYESDPRPETFAFIERMKDTLNGQTAALEETNP